MRLWCALLACVAVACRSDAPLQKEARWPSPKRGAVVSEHPLATAVGMTSLPNVVDGPKTCV